MTYKIIRFYQHAENVVTRTGLTFEEAQTHCNNPETSSSTATDPKVDERGPWFDGYEEETT
jgi:hypothetical protein